ncbi:hypothetical protein [Ohtaekwangia koreensis]|uniref:Uncharacterized protein n=1 Tax=Ohtaekwangia koreensis TaxID=688867 RepID=A0A1T5M1D4_9BACT|nr:hypothetical protein [Ohtaekwangia koreensis]SKC82062.1 hypothetical protein SAMN05660236_4082 [Ohtaekwangia koreensis]
MKKTPLLILLCMLFGLLNCSEEETKSNDFNSDELSFTTSKSNVSELSAVLGITSLENGGLSKGNTFHFSVSAGSTTINGHSINLDKTSVTVIKHRNKTYQVAATIENVGAIDLLADANKNLVSLTLDGQDVDVSQGLNPTQHLAIILASNLLNEVRINSDYKVNRGSIKAKADSYYGYTVGWGFTAEESVDHEASVRSGSSGISANGCRYLGTSTSCVTGSIGCVTISTFKCTGNSAT